MDHHIQIDFYSTYFPGFAFSPSSVVSRLGCRVILLFISTAKPVSTLRWIARRTGFFFLPSSENYNKGKGRWETKTNVWHYDRPFHHRFESISSSFVVLVLWAFGLGLDMDLDRAQSWELQLMHMICFELLCISGLEQTVCALFEWHWRETRLHSPQRIFTLSELFRASSGLCLYSNSTYSGFSLDSNLYELVWTRTLPTHMHLPLVERTRSPIPNLCQKSGARSPLNLQLNHSIFKNHRSTVFMLLRQHKTGLKKVF